VARTKAGCDDVGSEAVLPDRDGNGGGGGGGARLSEAATGVGSATDRGGAVVLARGGEHVRLPADLGDIADADETQPVVEKRGVEVVTECQLATDHQFTQIRTGADGAPELHDRKHWLDARQLLVPPANAAAQLFTTADPSLVRSCADPTCTLWFYERTKSHRRRWCSMAVCGNRAKARNHRQGERRRQD